MSSWVGWYGGAGVLGLAARGSLHVQVRYPQFGHGHWHGYFPHPGQYTVLDIIFLVGGWNGTLLLPEDSYDECPGHCSKQD